MNNVAAASTSAKVETADLAVSNNSRNATADDNDVPLATKAFGIFQDVVAAEMTEENNQLRKDNDRLHGRFDEALSTVRVVLLGREYTARLEDGTMIPATLTPEVGLLEGEGEGAQERSLLASDYDFGSCPRFQIPLEGVESVPLLSLGQNMLPNMMGGGGGGGIPTFTAEPAKLKVGLGSTFQLGYLGIGSAFEGGKMIVKESPNDGSHRLTLFLSDSVLVEGRLNRISEQDISDGYERLNQNLSARIYMGAPAAVNSENATFTMNMVSLRMKSGLEETLNIVLARYDVQQAELPHCHLRNSIAAATSGDGAGDGRFSLALEQNHQLNATNRRLNAVRDRLQTIDICYRSGSARAKLDQGSAALHHYGDGKATSFWVLGLASLSDTLIRIPINDLHTTEIYLGGVKVSGKLGFVGMPVMAFPDDNSTLRIEIPFGLGRLHFDLDPDTLPDVDEEEGMHALAENFQGRFLSALSGVQDNFPDEVSLLLVGISLDRSKRSIQDILGKLDVSVEEQLHSGSEGNEEEEEEEVAS